MSKQRKTVMQARPIQRTHAAGIDIGATSIYVAVPLDRDPQPVRSFHTFTEDLHRALRVGNNKRVDCEQSVSFPANADWPAMFELIL
jgi:hypothetical protein